MQRRRQRGGPERAPIPLLTPWSDDMHSVVAWVRGRWASRRWCPLQAPQQRRRLPKADGRPASALGLLAPDGDADERQGTRLHKSVWLIMMDGCSIKATGTALVGAGYLVESLDGLPRALEGLHGAEPALIVVCGLPAAAAFRALRQVARGADPGSADTNDRCRDAGGVGGRRRRLPVSQHRCARVAFAGQCAVAP